MDIVIVEIDPGKNSCSVAGLDASGRGSLEASDATDVTGELCRGPGSWRRRRAAARVISVAFSLRRGAKLA
jgi:hypothetical protein